MTGKQVRVGIAILVIRDGKVLLGHRAEKAKDTGGIYEPGTWTLPGGKQEYGETVLQGAAREVREETGLEIDNLQVFGVSDDIQPDRQYVTIQVLAGSSAGEPRVMEPEKEDDWQWFDPDLLPERLYSPSEQFLMAYLAKRT